MSMRRGAATRFALRPHSAWTTYGSRYRSCGHDQHDGHHATQVRRRKRGRALDGCRAGQSVHRRRHHAEGAPHHDAFADGAGRCEASGERLSSNRVGRRRARRARRHRHQHRSGSLPPRSVRTRPSQRRTGGTSGGRRHARRGCGRWGSRREIVGRSARVHRCRPVAAQPPLRQAVSRSRLPPARC